MAKMKDYLLDQYYTDSYASKNKKEKKMRDKLTRKPPQVSGRISSSVTLKPKKGKVFLSPDAARRAATMAEQKIKEAKPTSKKESKVNKKALKAANKPSKSSAAKKTPKTTSRSGAVGMRIGGGFGRTTKF
jgi:hypothetical protein